MNLDVLFFGMLAEAVQKHRETMHVESPMSLADLKNFLENKYSTLKEYTYKIAVNEELANDESLLINKDVCVALLPAYAGG
ncbi:MoaD/ThiS family protein [Xanthovirga aplysinae]|uniref:MoaD/ThiS family protein n=1 Tax=Xanthovirga aplysinae TaxID=2529853 RepID=UPI0012BB9B48|nr:MoaD/ThiS family protein [Xanthovirga aplysinae]MTI33486.1 MoaD/ThiS family protein [Xanthovirga aplysinae]